MSSMIQNRNKQNHVGEGIKANMGGREMGSLMDKEVSDDYARYVITPASITPHFSSAAGLNIKKKTLQAQQG